MDFENEDIEDIEDEMNDNNNLNLSSIKKYAPDIYNTYEYDKYDNSLTKFYVLIFFIDGLMIDFKTH